MLLQMGFQRPQTWTCGEVPLQLLTASLLKELQGKNRKKSDGGEKSSRSGYRKKDEDEEKKKGEMREAARKELDEWYKNHDEQVVKTRQSNRSAEKELVADTEPMAPGTEWERIAKLCDFNPKASKHTKDISRMRSIILQVKQGPPPGKTAAVEKK